MTTLAQPQVTEVSLSIRDLTLSFGDGRHPPVLSGVSLDLRPGRVLGLVGESGSGKSLTASAAIGLLPANAVIEEGSITFRDAENEVTEITSAGEEQLSAVRGTGIGMVFQNPLTSLDPTLTVGGHFHRILARHDRSLSTQNRTERALAWLTRVGFEDPGRALSSYPHELSGGMRQRTVIALVCSSEPSVLIADEPTTALDTVVQKQVLDLLKSIVVDSGISLLLITHDFDVIAHLADDVIVLRGGRVIERGTRDEILSSPSHPYTRQLIAAVPWLGRRHREAPGRRLEAPGEVLLSAEGLTCDFVSGGWGTGQRKTVHRAVNEVSLRVRQGEIYGIIGRSGSGKSTLARILGGLEDRDAGRVDVAGVEVSRRNRSDRKLRTTMQYVFQDPFSSLNPALTVGRQIARPLKRFGKPHNSDAVTQALELVGLDASFASRHPEGLSGGQAQRVCIARALAINPDLLILDEPTSALDVSAQAEIVELILDLRKSMGLTCVFISHDLGLIEWVADRIGVMSAGRLVDEFEVSELQDHNRSPEVRALIGADLSPRKKVFL